MRGRRASWLRALSYAAHLAALLAIVTGCGREETPAPENGGADTMPGAALTERALRDSARVAALFVAYEQALARGRVDEARELFFPESILVATPSGGVEAEGRSAALESTLAGQRARARPVRRIVSLRRAERELLENLYRETWWARWVPEDPDSSLRERRFHVLQQLGRDDRWLGSMSVSP